VNWLKWKYRKYKKLEAIQGCLTLTPEQKKVLLGIHKNQQLAKQPSKTDFKVLNKFYSKSVIIIMYCS